MEDKRVCVGGFGGSDEPERAALWSLHRAADNRIEGELHIGGGEFTAIVKLYALAKMKNVGERVWSFPALGEVGDYVHLRVVSHQAGKNQAVEVGGISVRTDARVEVGGSRLNEEYDGVRVSLGAKIRAPGWNQKGN